jgi:hypothetical protein
MAMPTAMPIAIPMLTLPNAAPRAAPSAIPIASDVAITTSTNQVCVLVRRTWQRLGSSAQMWRMADKNLRTFQYQPKADEWTSRSGIDAAANRCAYVVRRIVERTAAHDE